MTVNFRKKLIVLGFEITSKLYTNLIKRNQSPWKITKKQLLNMNSDTLGHQLGLFLEKNGFDLIPRAERHDCFHVFANYNAQVENEIALQYLRLGNGARSIYTFGAIIFGTILLPEYCNYYLKSYYSGKKAINFQNLDFKENLTTPLEDLRFIYFKQVQLI